MPYLQSRSLHDSIFGRSPRPKKQKSSVVSSTSSRAKQLFSKLLASNGLDDDRTISTESLPTTCSTSSMDGNLLYGRRWLLRLYDRRKSASTGELNKDSNDETTGSYTELRDGQQTNNSGSLLSVPQVRCSEQ